MEFLNTLLEKYQVRKTKKQKTAFLEWACAEMEKMGYAPRVEEHKDLFNCRNLIVGNPEEAKVIFTAHYDTPPVMPIPNIVFPQNSLLTLGVQLPLIAVMFFMCFGVRVLADAIGGENAMLSFVLMEVGLLAVVFGFLGLLFFGPANRHNANDNTSGTACLMEMMARLAPEERAHAAFIFFDQEEKGKVGSLAFAKKYPVLKKNGFVFNLDCIGDGKHMMIVAPKKADTAQMEMLGRLFPENEEFTCQVTTARKANYNSDQRSFRQGYAMAALHRHPKLGLHLNKIHTSRDTVCDEKNIQYVMDGCLRLLKQKAEEN